MSNLTIIMILAVVGLFVLLRLGIFDRIRGIRTLDVIEANELINNHDAIVLDVREADEYVVARIPDAKHIPLRQIERRLGELASSKDKPILVSCRSGHRSAHACSMLRRHGFDQVYNLKGGLAAWARADLALERSI